MIDAAMKIVSTLLFAILLSAASAFAEGVEDEVLGAEKGWAASVVAGDFDQVEALLDDTLIYAHSSGVIESKSGYVGRLRSGAQSYSAIIHEKTTVRVHGGAAVVHSIGQMTGQNPEGAFDNHLMIMHTWVKADGKWLLAAHQTTQLVE